MTFCPKDIIKNIRLERVKKGFSQEVMAELIGLSQNAYSKIERGDTQLHLSRLHEIVIALNIAFKCLLKKRN